MKKVLLYFWTLPQNLLGLLMLNYYRPTRSYELEDGTEIYYSSRISGGLTYGKYVFVDAIHYRNDIHQTLLRDTVRHNAIGHTRQSKLLGWLYFPLLWFSLLIGKILGKNKYEFGMEKWADKIAYVVR